MITRINDELYLDLEEVVMVRKAPYKGDDWLLYLFHLQEPIEITVSVAAEIAYQCESRGREKAFYGDIAAYQVPYGGTTEQ